MRVFEFSLNHQPVWMWAQSRSPVCQITSAYSLLKHFWHSSCIQPGGGGTQYKSGYRDVPQTWVAKSGRQVCQWVPFHCKIWYFHGCDFQNFPKFAPKWRKFEHFFKNFDNLRPETAQIFEKICNFWLKILKIWYVDGSIFLENWYFYGCYFQIPSGRSLPKPKLSHPPPGVRILFSVNINQFYDIFSYIYNVFLCVYIGLLL